VQAKNKIPVIDVAKCIDCEKCITVCPTNAICKNSSFSCSKCIKYCLTMKVPCNPDHYVFCYEQCDACGLCVSACRVDAIRWFEIKKYMKKHFDQVAQNWDKNQIHVKRTEAIAASFLQKTKLFKGMKALEFGAGTGLLSFALKDHFADITLMDSSAEMIKITEEKIKSAEATTLHPLLFDMEKEDYIAKTFDVIFSQMVMHHVDDIEKMIAKFGKLLDRGGILAIADLYKEDGSFHEMEFHGHLGFDPEQLGETLKKNGFININHEQCFEIERLSEDSKLKKFPVFLMTAENRD